MPAIPEFRAAWLAGEFTCPKCGGSGGAVAPGVTLPRVFLPSLILGRPHFQCLKCYYTANRREFMGKGKQKKRKGTKPMVALPMSNIANDDSTVTKGFEKCPQCGTKPVDNWQTVDWNTWESGVCPNCLADLNEIVDKGSGVVVYEKGVKKAYPSYDAYHKSKFGHSYYDKGYSDGSDYSYNWSSICSHDEAVEIAPGLEIKAFSYRGATPKKLKSLDYFVALDSIWLDEGEILTTPGVNFRIPVSRAMPKLLYLVTPDFGTPNSLRVFIELVEWSLIQMKSGKKLGVGCMGGHGRTGVFLTALLLAAGTFKTGGEATAYLRKAYCKEAVESMSQAALLTSVAKHIWGPDADGDLGAVEDAIFKANKVVLPVTDATPKIYNWGVLPKAIRVKKGVGDKYADAKPYENVVLPVTEWGTSRGTVIALTPTGARITLFETEYDVEQLGKPDLLRAFTRVAVRHDVTDSYLKQFAGQACQVLAAEKTGVDGEDDVMIVKVLLPDGTETRLYDSEYIPLVDWGKDDAKESKATA